MEHDCSGFEQTQNNWQKQNVQDLGAAIALVERFRVRIRDCVNWRKQSGGNAMSLQRRAEPFARRLFTPPEICLPMPNHAAF